MYLIDHTGAHAALADAELDGVQAQLHALRLVRPAHAGAQGPVPARAAVVGDILVVADRNGVLYGLDLATGAQRWRTELQQAVLADLSSTETAVFVSLQDGVLKVVNPVTGDAQDVPYKQ